LCEKNKKGFIYVTKKITIPSIQSRKGGEKISMVTAYDYPTAQLLEKAGIEIILVGDSLGTVLLGHSSTVPVTMDNMLHHTRAVTKAVSTSLVVADMPFLSYQVSVEEAIRNAGLLIKEGGAEAVKLEGGTVFAPLVQRLVERSICVMGHIGLTPQSVSQLGGYKVQGKKAEKAKELVESAKALEKAGAFSIVLECVPDRVARIVTESIGIPTIGIGAGPWCDGQVLVFHDMMGLTPNFSARFVKQYADLPSIIVQALQQFSSEIKSSTFPSEEHSFPIEDSEFEQIQNEKKRVKR
jgi:3-methyl-2-oxobutanoate hydroxymethyltransferase